MRSTSSTARSRRGGHSGRALAAAGLGALALAAAAGLVGILDPLAAAAGLPDLCAFHHLTGRDCPGCGMVRSLASLAAGKPQAAFAAHPFGPALVVIAGLLVALPAASRARLREAGWTGGAGARAASTVVLAWWLVARVLPAA